MGAAQTGGRASGTMENRKGPASGRPVAARLWPGQERDQLRQSCLAQVRLPVTDVTVGSFLLGNGVCGWGVRDLLLL